MTEVFWQCPKCRHRVSESETVCQKCGRTSDGREATYVVPRGRSKSIPEMELEIKQAHAEAMSVVPASQPSEEETLVFYVPKGWKGWVVVILVTAFVIGIMAAAAFINL